MRFVTRGAVVVDRRLEGRAALERAGACCRQSAAQLPHLPRGAVHHRLGEQRGHVGVVSELPLLPAHLVGVLRTPHVEVRGGDVGLIARVDCGDQGALHRGRITGVVPGKRTLLS